MDRCRRVDDRHCNIETGVCDRGCMFDVREDWRVGPRCDVIICTNLVYSLVLLINRFVQSFVN